MQCRSKPVSGRSLRKTGIIADVVGDFRQLASPKSWHWEPRDEIECAKSRDFRPYYAFLWEPGRTSECLAGDAVHIAPVST